MADPERQYRKSIWVNNTPTSEININYFEKKAYTDLPQYQAE